MAKKKQHKRYNPIILLLIAMLILLLLSAATLYIIYSHPTAVLLQPPDFNPGQVDRFEPWSFSLGEIRFSFPDGGVMIPALHEQEQWGALISGNGELLKNGDETKFSSIFLVIEPGQWKCLKGDILFIPIKDPVLNRQYLNLFRQQSAFPSFSIFGFQVSLFPRGDSFFSLPYHEKEPLAPVYSYRILWFTAAYYILVSLLILTITYIITVDMKKSRWKSYLNFTWKKEESLIFPLVLILVYLPQFLSLPAHQLLGYTALIALLLVFRIRKKLPPLNFGLSLHYLVRSTFTGLAVGMIFLLFISPLTWKSFSFNIPFPSATTLATTFLLALTREVVYRGYIQSSLERLLGHIWGLLASVTLLSACGFAVYALQTSTWFPPARLGPLITLPALHLLNGFLYQQSENIAGPAITHWLLLFLPTLLYV